MKLLCEFILIALLVAVRSESSFLCEVKQIESHGIGCEISGVTVTAAPLEIKLSKYSRSYKAADMKWIRIDNSTFSVSPKQLLDKFPKAKRVFMEHIHGWKSLNETVFNALTERIEMRDTSLEHIGARAFRGLTRLTHLNLTHSKIATVEKEAFAGLFALNSIDLSFNKIESLDDDLFENNISLLNITLSHNEMKSISVELFSKALELIKLDLSFNKITDIEEGFASNLGELLSIGLSSNICVDKLLTDDDVFDLKLYLEICFMNFAHSHPPSE